MINIANVQLQCSNSLKKLHDQLEIKSAKSDEFDKLIDRIDVESIKQEQINKICSFIKEAKKNHAHWVIFPELSITGFFPYLYFKDEGKLTKFFDGEDITKSILNQIYEIAREQGIAVSFGYAELTEQNKKYNTFVTIDSVGGIYKYRKTHLPGYAKITPGLKNFQFEKAIFDESDEGYPVFDMKFETAGGQLKEIKVGMIICHDRRYNAPYLILGKKGCQILINGYNTPVDLTFAEELNDYVLDFHYLPQRSQAITEGIYIISSAMSGKNYGIDQIGGSCIISPYGKLIARQDDDSEKILYGMIDVKQCEEVKKQKYNGERARYEILLSEAINYSDLETTLNFINFKYGSNLKIDDVYESILAEDSSNEYHKTWLQKANTTFDFINK